jgi:catechol 2,3-dioxygenase-like lactoylglutathione lyase family enzyme
MFDHVTLRVPDLAAATVAFGAVLDELEFTPTVRTPAFSVWGNFALTETDEQHPIARRVHVAFIAPTPDRVDQFARAGVQAGFTEDGPPGPRVNYADGYYMAHLNDDAGNSFEAVHHDDDRPTGNIDHVAIRVENVDASASFYSTIGPAAGLTLRSQAPDVAVFVVGGSDGLLSVTTGEPTEDIHIAFSGEDDDVRRFHSDAISAGYRSNGEPGERPRYHEGYYSAYVLDPDGNNIEVVNHHR